jgi:NAD(P)-dependent dehydrogenase (short-subunit alcohol dehydrogenase family)
VRICGPALVTGASRGLGRAVALALAQRGFDVFATMRDPEAGRDLPREADGTAGSIRVARLDLDRPESIDLPADLQVLVNNAGIETTWTPVEHVAPAALRRVFETNLFGLAEVTRRAVPALRVQRGVVCNVTSAALLFPMPFFSVYRASKAAVQALGESLAVELAEHGVRVIEVLPGPIDTDMLRGPVGPFEAVGYEDYARLARWAMEGRRATEMHKTPAPEAARRIVDAILDEASPHRVACDPVGEALLRAADATPHAERMAAALRASRG